MKKSFVIILFILVLDLFLARASFAATPTTTPVPDVTAPTSSPQNIAPRIGIPCGKTLCLAGEECIQYPGDIDQHCVPMTPTPSISPTISISPSISPSPTHKIIPTAPLPPKCGDGTGVFPPNSTCWNDIKETQKDVKLYDKTCIYQPVVKYSDTRKYNSGKQPFSQCGIGEGPNGEVGPGGDDPDCDVALLINTDVKNADIGSYGPSVPAEEAFSSDFLAQNYLYNSLFGRPLDLSDSPDNNGEYPNREAYRTYWRLMPASNQANLRSFIMNMASDKQIDNISFDYVDQKGVKRKTDFVQLYNSLKTQVILFWHFPFVRVGCLTSYPVCPEYAQAQRELIPDFTALRALAELLDISPLVNPLISVYETAISVFQKDLSGPYAAFVPLDFDSVRGYILKRKDEVEEETYTRFNYFNLPEYKLTNISFENLPYVGAVYQGLLSPKFGMIPALQPQWIVDKYTGKDGLSDYQLGNEPEDLPEVKIANKNFIEQITEEIQAVFSNPFGWISDKIKSFFTDEDKKKGYIPAKEDVITNPLRVEEIREVYDNPVGCPLSISYHELTPKTAAYSVDDHHQVVTIRGNKLAWSYTPSCSDLVSECKINPLTGLKECGTQFSCSGKDEYIENGQCCTPEWSVEATKDAKALNVLNNPKQTDIKGAVVDNQEYSLYSMMLPDGQEKIPEAGIDAPIANHLYLRTAPNGTGEVLNPYEPINRISNLAQDSMHFLQNCWVVPNNLQNSPRCVPTLSSATCGELPEMKPLPSCSVKNNSLNLPPSLIKAIETAASTFNVPPGLMIGLMYGEGAFNPGASVLNESFVVENLPACTKLPGCNPSSTPDIDGIFHMSSNWFKEHFEAVKKFDPNREPNACNLLDEIFAVAKIISENQYGSPAFAGKTCFGIPLVYPGSGLSSSSCNWDESHVETAIRVWEFGVAYDSTYGCATAENGCLLGGMAAACLTGGDTCETKTNRYSAPSHNACVYDVYKEN